MRRLWALCLGWAFTGVAMSQSLPAVTITATRTENSPFDVPASVDVLSGERLRAGGRAEINISEGLGGVPGVAARERQNYAQDLQLSIRGFGSRSSFGVRGVRLYVDGIPATMPDGQGQLSHIDLASAGRVEVLRGPFSVLYGNSSGGVMQVFTDPGEGPPQLGTSLVTGSDGLARVGLRASGRSGGLGYVVSVNRFAIDGWREHSGASRSLGNARLDMQGANGGEWTVVANAVQLRADDPLGLSRAQFEAAPRSADASALQFNTRKTVRQSQLGLIHELSLSGGDRVRLMLYGGERETQQFQAIPVAAQANALHAGGVIGLQRRYAGADLRWTARRQLAGAPLEVVAGLAYDRLGEQRQGWQNFSGAVLGVQGALRRDEDNTVSNLDPYVQAAWKFAPRWTLTAGVRHSRVRFASSDRYIMGANGDDSGRIAYSATLPVTGLMLELSPRTHAYAAFGRGFETPTFNELAYRPDGSAGLNFALGPSRSNNLELGLKGRMGGDAGDGARSGLRGDLHGEWALAWFQTRTQGEIVTQTNSGGRSTFRNAGATVRRGLEASWRAQLGRAWELQLAQTWLDARFRDGFATCSATPCAVPTLAIPAGNRIPGTARSVTAAELGWRPAQGWQGGIELRRSSRVWVDDANSDAAGAYTTLALHGGYALQRGRWTWSAFVRVDNALDRPYAGSVIVNEGNRRFFEPAPGRNYTAKLSASYAF